MKTNVQAIETKLHTMPAAILHQQKPQVQQNVELGMNFTAPLDGDLPLLTIGIGQCTKSKQRMIVEPHSSCQALFLDSQDI